MCRLILPLILASVLADLVGAWLLPNTLMTEKLLAADIAFRQISKRRHGGDQGGRGHGH